MSAPRQHLVVEIGWRLSVANSAERKALVPDDPYVTVSEGPAFAALERLAQVPLPLTETTLREACGLPPVPAVPRVLAWLRDRAAERAQGANPASGPASVLDLDLRTEPSLVFDLGVRSLFLGADPAAAETGPLTAAIFGAMAREGAKVGVGRYGEARVLYASALFAGSGTDERRTLHLGLDLFVAPGSPPAAPRGPPPEDQSCAPRRILSMPR